MVYKLSLIKPACNMNRSSKLQKKAKASDTHIDKRRSVITTFPICKEKRKKLRYEKTATKLNPEGLDFPDSFMAVMGWRRVKV